MSQTNISRCVALPETRELDLFASMLEERGVRTIRCPLIAILDAPDPAPIESWLRELVAGRFDDLIFLTGEGIRRLMGVADRADMRDSVIEAFAKARKFVRGPKPGRALREIGMKPDVPADTPTTDGVISTLQKYELRGRCVGVQLYGSDPNTKLMDFLRSVGADPRPVAPYIYASQADDARVLDLIDQMLRGDIDAIAFTSTPQIRRLFDVAQSAGRETQLREALANVKVAAIGPVVAEELEDAHVRVDMMPEESFFMKPLVRQIMAAFGANTDI